MSGIDKAPKAAPVLPTKRCWKCQFEPLNIPQEHIMCPECHAIQLIPDEASHFQVLRMPNAQFRINPDLLEQNYKSLQRVLHPDRFASRSQKEKQISEIVSSKVNKAFDTLKDPQKRAKYLIEDVFGESVTAADIPQDFLMEMLELQELLEEDPDSLSQERLRDLYEELSRDITSLQNDVAYALDDAQPVPDLIRARQDLAKMNYLVRARKQVYDLLDVK